jgi:hypothetical protein
VTKFWSVNDRTIDDVVGSRNQNALTSRTASEPR